MTGLTKISQTWSFNDFEARIFHHTFRGTAIKTLVIGFPGKRLTLSSRRGFRRVRFICNNFNPPELWDFLHNPENMEAYYEEILSQLNIPRDDCVCLFTGVDMDDVALAVERFEDFIVYAYVTAGVDSNAMRVGVDRAGSIERDGEFERLKTINTILITNASLSEGAMVQSIIVATEAKTIALQDLDVRSSYNPALQATGTGTDNIVVASGEGLRISYTGGHSKMGEMIARAVTKATKEAIVKHRLRKASK
ncbi:MAG: cobalamin biosynthesis protein CbiZ [Candidatus Hecatellales archaeon]|nr:MAG: cobalamin biosynthesis protein CbiZ [Candidatus Hecatellales archaeon]